MSEKFCDLHIHSTFSDGTFTPEEIVELALKANLSAIALTDHNTVDGCPHILAAAEGKSIEVGFGTELATESGGTELHLI